MENPTSGSDDESVGQVKGTAPDAPAAALVEEDLLVEDVSIDGMCGVY
ncbi:MAG: mycofactocin precursor MftA [Solirubrobacteraceae bacterium]|nr:mycofactocin precursor MftA [Solirubrobacteraceae bacterium]